MPSFRIVYLRPDNSRPETIIAAFENLDHALEVFAARGLRILYIAEADKVSVRLQPTRRGTDPESRPAGPCFAPRHFSARVPA